MGWHIDFPAELAGRADLRFTGQVTSFRRSESENRKTIFAISTDGDLVQLWDESTWKLDFPAALAGHPDLRFSGRPAAFRRDSGGSKKAIYAMTSDGRIAQIWDTSNWNLDFPAEHAGHSGLRFQGSPAVYPRNAGDNRKALYAVTTDGRLAQLWDTSTWNLDYPAELAGHPDLRFQGSPCVVPTGGHSDPDTKAISAVTTDGRLVDLADGHHWYLVFVAEHVGQPDLRVRACALEGAGTRYHYAVTDAHRIVVLWTGASSPVEHPVPDLAFNERPSPIERDGGQHRHTFVAVSADGRLVAVKRWPDTQVVFPAEEAGEPGLRFKGVPTMTNNVFAETAACIAAVTDDGRLAQLWYTIP